MPDTPAAFLVLDDALASLGEGSRYDLAGEEGRHAAKVARIRAGERILLSDADGRQARAEVTEARKEELSLCLLEAPSDPVARSPRLSLVQALATGGRDEQAIESATELGVDRVTPWIAHRSVSVWKGEKLRKGRARWESTVRAAVKQCRRRGIPAVDEARTSAQLVEDLRERNAAGAMVLVLHEQESVGLMGLAEQLRALRADEVPAGVPEIVVVVGPEGGISPEELAQLKEAGARSVLLGPEVLRSSTAGPAAIAVISALVGRWG
ncbi:16S rRNA (uracil(1498)-N(3))-methyltransferase [Brachybacterium halotolerans subsp. kimchii]|uniref:16S rRNA (uracil(1498)-N(3))-methyltransferase n=1 Tax=Brachybacterium halotolerans TaxID=2795215 RepID=UPI001E2EDA9C|nr:16S rRNA (uracil(1498)-N(3))-methyltransferase [Brachybacterium halotolerans]UEJ83079.1 16S rRNA (uracil(1498)-N(3))-methyltransferase [Brachybacterium halotolerans subsp. kimchii]